MERSDSVNSRSASLIFIIKTNLATPYPVSFLNLEHKEGTLMEKEKAIS